MMTRVSFHAALILCCASSTLSEPATWLMQGDLMFDEDATARHIQLDTHKTYFPVSTRAEIYYAAQRGKLINCVIAAAVHQNGHVSVVQGGYKAKKVRIRYTTESGKSDVFFVLVQASRRMTVSVEGDVAKSARLGIVYEPMKGWTVDEIQDALRNVTATPFPS